MPRVLVACEMSGRVRVEFAARGWDAWSADLLPDESVMWNGIGADTLGQHYQGDVLNIIRDDWDLIIAHPPCTDLSQAGARYWKEKQASGEQQKSARFFRKMIELPCPKSYVVVENPRGIMSSLYRKPDQVVQPWMFDDSLKKETCLWYRGAAERLPAVGYDAPEYKMDHLAHLVPTHTLADYPGGVGRTCTGGGSWRTDTARGLTGMNQNWEDSQGRHRRSILRSITPAGMAREMARQWGSYIEERR